MGSIVGQRSRESKIQTPSWPKTIGVHYRDQHRYNDDLLAARFSLDNGLTVILMIDRRAPVFAYQTWFRVGSRHEDPTRTGLAHLFEHLMFKGTRTHPAGTFDREMERRGTQTNAATWVDWTFYTQSLAARGDNLKTLAGFEADRMRNLVLDGETFRSELEVVKNERRMSVDNSIGGTLQERLYALAFREHPYRWPTIGSMAHLEAVSLADLEQFYRAYYAPNNAVLVVAGDLDPKDTLAVIARHYGPLAPQSIPQRPTIVEPEQREPRFEQVVRPVAATQLVIGYRAIEQAHVDFAALEMLNDILVGGDSARLYRRLVTEERLALDVDGMAPPFVDPGLYQLSLTLQEGASVEHVLGLVQEELDGIARGLADGEIEKARNSLELGGIDGFRDAESCAEALGHYETNDHDYRRAFAALARWQHVDEVALRRVAAEIFRPTRRSVVTAVASEAVV